MTSERRRGDVTTASSEESSKEAAAAWKQRGREASGKGLPGIDPLTLQLYNEVVNQGRIKKVATPGNYSTSQPLVKKRAVSRNEAFGGRNLSFKT